MCLEGACATDGGSDAGAWSRGAALRRHFASEMRQVIWRPPHPFHLPHHRGRHELADAGLADLGELPAGWVDLALQRNRTSSAKPGPRRACSSTNQPDWYAIGPPLSESDPIIARGRQTSVKPIQRRWRRSTTAAA